MPGEIVDWPYAMLLAAGVLLIGAATWLVYRLGCSAEDSRRDGERAQGAEAESGPEDEVGRDR